MENTVQHEPWGLLSRARLNISVSFGESCQASVSQRGVQGPVAGGQCRLNGTLQSSQNVSLEAMWASSRWGFGWALTLTVFHFLSTPSFLSCLSCFLFFFSRINEAANNQFWGGLDECELLFSIQILLRLSSSDKRSRISSLAVDFRVASWLLDLLGGLN